LQHAPEYPLCEFVDGRCPVCGYQTQHANLKRNCGGRIPPPEPQPDTKVESPRPGLGDLVAAGLEMTGITKERVSALIGRPCGCPQRQAAMNQWGKKHLGIG